MVEQRGDPLRSAVALCASRDSPSRKLSAMNIFVTPFTFKGRSLEIYFFDRSGLGRGLMACAARRRCVRTQ